MTRLRVNMPFSPFLRTLWLAIRKNCVNLHDLRGLKAPKSLKETGHKVLHPIYNTIYGNQTF